MKQKIKMSCCFTIIWEERIDLAGSNLAEISSSKIRRKKSLVLGLGLVVIITLDLIII